MQVEFLAVNSFNTDYMLIFKIYIIQESSYSLLVLPLFEIETLFQKKGSTAINEEVNIEIEYSFKEI